MKKLSLLCGVCILSQTLFAWDYEGHRLVNQIALSTLPKDFPGFVLTPEAQTRITFLAGEPDRWRNTSNLELQHSQEPEHFLDVEELSLYGLTPETLPIFRYDFISIVGNTRKMHPEKFPPMREGGDKAHKYVWTGLLPWTITENYAKLKAEFSYLKAFEAAGGTPDEIASAKANIIYTMGVMGHYVGDSSQPLHTTMHFNGWIGENPKHYTTNHTIHSLIDGGYIGKMHIADELDTMKKKARTAQIVTLDGKAVLPDQMFAAVVAFIVEQNKLVETVYQMDKDRKFSGEGEVGAQGKPFIEGQLVKGGQLLGDIWYSAWMQAPVDEYLERQLRRRTETPRPAAPAADAAK